MQDKFSEMPKRDLSVDWAQDLGALDMRKHSFGIGGINPMPAPQAVVGATAALKPRMIRIFIQEFFYIYKGRAQSSRQAAFDWSRLDPYMDAVHAMGGEIMASICIKPKALFPALDEKIWMPNDVAEWQEVVRTLVLRYGKEKPYVTHWAIANEPNIGEGGGCPYLITDPGEMFEYYRMTVAPIIEALPGAVVGGPSHAGAGEAAAEYLGCFARLCKQHGVRLDFTCYNAYLNSPREHTEGALAIRRELDKTDPGIKLYMSEFNLHVFDDHIPVEKEYSPKLAAGLAASLLSMHDAGCPDGTFQYHIHEQWCDPRDFAPWFARTRHFTDVSNQVCRILVLLDLAGKPRPQYHLYNMLYALDGHRAAVAGNDDVMRALASRADDGTLSVFLANYSLGADAADTTTRIKFANAPEGLYNLTIRRITQSGSSSHDTVTDTRTLHVYPESHFDVFTPANTVVLVQLKIEN